MFSRASFENHCNTLLSEFAKRRQKEIRIQIRIGIRWTSFLTIPLTFVYDEYIDRPKLTNKKTHLSI